MNSLVKFLWMWPLCVGESVRIYYSWEGSIIAVLFFVRAERIGSFGTGILDLFCCICKPGYQWLHYFFQIVKLHLKSILLLLIHTMSLFSPKWVQCAQLIPWNWNHSASTGGDRGDLPPKENIVEQPRKTTVPFICYGGKLHNNSNTSTLPEELIRPVYW